jgi:hypothetical protein
MKQFLKLFFIILSLLVEFSAANAANNSSPQKPKDELKICEQGVTTCKDYEKKDDVKYSSCMRLACSAFYEPSAKSKKDEDFFFKLINFENELERVGENKGKTCEYGIKKCDSLSYSPTYYWRCMKEECAEPDNSADSNCSEGTQFCSRVLADYYDCVTTTCNNKNNPYEECSESKRVCTSKVKEYWRCVFQICLGPVDQYIKFARIKEFAIIEDKFGIKRRMEILKHEIVQGGVPENEKQAPPGVDPEEWVRDVPSYRKIVTNPSVTMRCIFPTAIMECATSDSASCFCSDGSKAVTHGEFSNMLDSYEEYKFFKDANDEFEKNLEKEFRIRGFYKELDKKYGVIRN